MDGLGIIDTGLGPAYAVGQSITEAPPEPNALEAATVAVVQPEIKPVTPERPELEGYSRVGKFARGLQLSGSIPETEEIPKELDGEGFAELWSRVQDQQVNAKANAKAEEVAQAKIKELTDAWEAKGYNEQYAEYVRHHLNGGTLEAVKIHHQLKAVSSQTLDTPEKQEAIIRAHQVWYEENDPKLVDVYISQLTDEQREAEAEAAKAALGKAAETYLQEDLAAERALEAEQAKARQAEIDEFAGNIRTGFKGIKLPEAEVEDFTAYMTKFDERVDTQRGPSEATKFQKQLAELQANREDYIALGYWFFKGGLKGAQQAAKTDAMTELAKIIEADDVTPVSDEPQPTEKKNQGTGIDVHSIFAMI